MLINMPDDNLKLAIDNLLFNCSDLKSGDSLLIVYENPELGWYEKGLADVIAKAAENSAILVQLLEVGAPKNNKDQNVIDAMENHSCTLFLARIGDQDRFATPTPGKKIIMCYIRDIEMLGSAFGYLPYQAMLDMKLAIDQLIDSATEIRIQCTLGTDCSVRPEPGESSANNEVTVRRFPLGVISPIDGKSLNGHVVLADYLTPTGSGVYQPANLELDKPVVAEIKNGSIVEFSGDAELVKKVEQHYREVASQFDIDANVIHSWHVGMHPGLSYSQKATDDPDRWSNTAFNHPRFAHFHTCGNYAPGEICWMLKDPTISLDGHALWQAGRLKPEAFELTGKVLKRWPALKKLYAEPAGKTGL